VAIVYADSSALVKLVIRESESGPLRTYLADAELVTSELALTEIPRAIRRAVAHDPSMPAESLLDCAAAVLDSVALRPLSRDLLAGAGALAEPSLRALDAIHVASAAGLSPVEAFVTYDERQAAAARLAGLRTMSPGA
jgi:predicted nucleic acid-binding protein